MQENIPFPPILPRPLLKTEGGVQGSVNLSHVSVPTTAGWLRSALSLLCPPSIAARKVLTCL